MTAKINPLPKFSGQSFACPHCGAFAHQSWLKVFSAHSRGNAPILKNFRDEPNDANSNVSPTDFLQLARVITGIPKLQILNSSNDTGNPLGEVANLHLSSCFSCKKLSVWVIDKLIYPESSYPIEPNSDLPEDIQADFNEARKIINLSPRGAAALLRLCIQKICIHVGEEGKNINSDISSLVKKGLDEKIQQSLDIVRVIGNEAVHPGTLDLKDDYSTAIKLLEIVNYISANLISRPKEIENIFKNLPSAQLAGIQARDKK